MKPIYIAAYHQSKFGKLPEHTLSTILEHSIRDTCAEISIPPSLIDVGTVAAACNASLNGQGLLAGLMANTSGLAGKPLESVENACASGGQAVLSSIYKMQAGLGDTALVIGFEKMRDAQGKMDGKRIGEVLGHFSDPTERDGKVFIFPHIFAEIMQIYMQTYGVTERDLAAIAVQEYSNARSNPFAQMNLDLTLDQATEIAGINRYVVDGLPLKTYDCSQITDGYAGLILATERGLTRLGLRKQDCVEIAGYGQAVDPLQKSQRQVLHPTGAYKAMNAAYAMAGATPADVNVAEIHDCFTVMGALGTEILGKAQPGCGARFWKDGNAAPQASADAAACAINTSGGLIAKGHPIGATGVAMIGWSALQLLGRAPAALRVPNPRLAATFNIGGPLCASVCTVLRHG